MENYSFSFEDNEIKQHFQEAIKESDKYEEKCTEIINSFKELEKISVSEADKFIGKNGIIIYWNENEIVHVKSCTDNKDLKLVGCDKISYTDVEEIYLTDLLNTINLEIKPKFPVDLKNKDKNAFLHLQKLSSIADIIEMIDEEAVEFCDVNDIKIIDTKAGSKYINLGRFLEKILKYSN